MKKLSSILLTVVVVLSAIVMSAQAGPPDNAEGLWQYQPFLVDAREAGCNTFMKTVENGEWSGTFDGISTEDGVVVVHCSGSLSFNAIVTFSEVTVEGHSGTLVMSVEGSLRDPFTDWDGRWVILRGTDELTTLRGQGTWWGPGAPDFGLWGDIYYAGNVHFEP